jgi:hypothetical protein
MASACLISLAGCAPAGSASSASAIDAADVQTTEWRDDDSAAPLGGDGLELRHWKVVDDSHRIVAAMTRHAQPVAQLGADESRLRRNGWRIVRVHLHDLAGFRDSLGKLTMDIKGWYGNIPVWRSLLEQPMGPAVKVIALDGRFRVVDADACRLMARGWSLVNEDGPSYQLELTPLLQVPHGQELLPRLRDQQPGNEPLTSSALQWQLEPGWAYVLTCEDASVDWNAAEVPAAATIEGDVASSLPDAFEPAEARATPLLQHSDATGPQVAAPPTLGRLLLGGDTSPPTRGMLIFIAHLPRSTMAREMNAPRAIRPGASADRISGHDGSKLP